MREFTRAVSAARHYRSLDTWDRPIGAVAAEAAAADPQRIAVIDGEVRLTRHELARAAAAVQRSLAAVGVRPGDVVSLQLGNTWATVAALHGAWAQGAVVNPITTIYRGRELETIFRSAVPAAVVVSSLGRGADFPAQARQALAAAGLGAAVLDIEEVLADARGAGPAATPAPVAAEPADPDDIALLMFTSGTTGTPKGVLHSHRTLLYEAASIAEVFGLDGDVVFMPSPLAHVTGLLYGVLTPVITNGAVSLLDRWEPERAVELIERDGCAFTVAATPFLRGLADRYAELGIRSSLRGFVCGGADIPAALVRDAERAMGLRISRTYGSTEMPTLCIVRPDDPEEGHLDSEGRPIGEAEARLSADGELEVRGPELFLGYLDPRDDTAAFTADGWFRTGDLAAIAASGAVTITGRRKDLIVRGGENISAKEVEDLLITLDAIAEVAVVGVPDPLMGERACAVVVARPGERVRLADLTAHLDRQAIARQKYPEFLWTVSDLPRTVSGKVQKYVLRQRAAEAAAAGALESRGLRG